jgi:cell division initiation protein
MRLTPLDIRKQEFKKAMRGLDADEVYAFLSTIADEYEAVINDNRALRERLLELDDKVQEYRNMEKTLRDTLLTAERVTVEAKDNARREAELIVKEAQIEAEKAVRDVRSTSMRLRQEIQTLRHQKDGYLSRLKVLVESHMKFIETAEKDFADEERRFENERRELESKKQVGEQAETQPKEFRKILDEVIEHQKDALKDEIPSSQPRPRVQEPAGGDAGRDPRRVQPSLVPDPAAGGTSAGKGGAARTDEGAAPGWSLDRLKRDILAGTTQPDEKS